MRLYPLRIGSTKVPYGQFYGGLSDWGLADFAQDKSHFIWVPIHAFLLEHPELGPTLVDTGIDTQQAVNHHEYYRGTIGEFVFDDDEYALPDGQRMEAQLARHGYAPSDITTVVLTHLHEDHVGSLHLFPHAEIVLARAEYEARDSLVFGLAPLAHPRSIENVQHWRPVDFTDPGVGGFDTSKNLTADGRITLLPTPGHSPGSTSVLVDMGDYRILLPGDAMYTIRHLATDDVRQLQVGDAPGFTDSLRRIQWLRRADPGLIILPGHDHTDYGEHMVAALVEGRVSEGERAWAASYFRDTFDEAYRLNPARRPRFLPSLTGEPVGAVR